MKSVDFSRDLIKGRIAEVIFEQMFRESGQFTILRFGYEYTMPELAQYRRTLKKEVVEDISNAPDFALISQSKKELYLVEVKFRMNPRKDDLKKIAETILKRWDPSWLFVASPHGFFFDSCRTIIQNNGEMGPLFDKWVTRESQREYLKLLDEFIQSKPNNI